MSTNPASRIINLVDYTKDKFRISQQRGELEYVYDQILKGKSKPEILNGKNSIPVEVERIIDFIDKYRKPLRSIKNLKKRNLTVSVVIPHYNQYEYLDQAIHFLTLQSSLINEVIVVDDVSNDQKKVTQIVNKYQPKLKIKLILSRKKLYAGGAKQLGAETAKEDIIVIHDADDLSHKDRIFLTKKFFQTHPNALHLNLGFVKFKGKNYLDYIKPFKNIKLEKYIINSETILQTMREHFINQRFSIFKSYGSHLGWYGVEGDFGFNAQAGHPAYRKEVVKIIKWHTPQNYVFTKFEDYEFNLLLLLAGGRSYQLDLPLIYYRIGTSTNLVNY